MRTLLLGVLIAALAGCSPPSRSSQLRRIELGGTGLEVAVDNAGNGRYISLATDGQLRSGTFKIGTLGFDKLRTSLAGFEERALPLEKVRAVLEAPCPRNVPRITDAGMITVRWISASTDRAIIADLGCDHEKLAARNQKLAEVLASLPVPERSSFP